jgi:hypothetical protein
MEVVNFNWKLLGAKLARLSDAEQGDFFDGFAKELDSFDSHLHKETQMISAGYMISDSAKNTLKEYFPSLWFNEE